MATYTPNDPKSNTAPIAADPNTSPPRNTFDPTNGETPLAQLPQYGGAGGSDQAAQFYAGQAFYKQFGRNPTPSELAMLAPAYLSGDPNIAGVSQGNAAVAQYFQSQSNTPDQINKSNQEKYLKEAPKHFDAVNQLFQTNLGRPASQDELNHFGSALASGATDAYGLQQFLQQQPEYQTKQNEAFQTKLGGQLAASDKQYFGEQILPSIQEAYAKQGRSFDSSGFKNAATQSAQQQNVARQNYLANLSAQQYGGVEDRAYKDYAARVANQADLTNAGINAQYQGLQGVTNRVNQISDYSTQAQLYNQYLARYGKRNNGLGAAIGGVAGGGIGAIVGGPMGGMLGFQLGSAAGGATQNATSGSY